MTFRSAKSPLLVSLLLVGLGSAWYGCSAGNDSETGFGDTATTQSTTGSGAASATGVGGSGPSGTTGNGGFNPIGSGGGTGGIDECSSTDVQAELIPLDMIIVLDESGSM